jgi:hypothetical protein
MECFPERVRGKLRQNGEVSPRDKEGSKQACSNRTEATRGYSNASSKSRSGSNMSASRASKASRVRLVVVAGMVGEVEGNVWGVDMLSRIEEGGSRRESLVF